MPIDHNAIRRNNWSQGSVLTTADTAELLRIDPNGELDRRLILVSHDCDIVHGGDREPLVEFVLAAGLAGQLNGNCRFGKNPRVLHLMIAIGGANAPHELLSSGRHSFQREVLETRRPDPAARISESERDQITRWLAKRYNREAFPDSFNDRRSQADRAIREALRVGGEHLSGIYLALSSNDELGTGDVYKVQMYGIMPKERYEIAEYLQRGQEAVASMAAAMDACDGIEVIDHDVYSEDDFTLHDLRFVQEFNCDDLSLRTDPPGAMLPGS